MDFISYFFWLAAQAGDHPYFLYPAAVLLSVAAIFWILSPHDSAQESLLLLPLPSAATVLILILGTAFQSCASEQASSVVVALIVSLLLLEIPLVFWAASCLRSWKGVVLSLGALQVWYACFAALVAIMSVTDSWF